jgi:hypothetical protein
VIHFVVPGTQDFSIREYLASWGEGLADRMRVVSYSDLPRLTTVARGTWVFAAIDQLGDGMRDLTHELHRALSARGSRILNDPHRTLVRYPLLRALHERGVNDFRAVRADDPPGDLRYPVFLRDERSHGGPLSPLLGSAAEVRREIGRALLDGKRMRDLILIEYCDTADADGYYRKYSAFAVGAAVIPRSVAYGHSWMLKHHGSEYSRAMVEAERDYVLGNPHQRELTDIFVAAGVEYGRIDYAVQDGALRVWEINLNPTIGRGTRPPSGRIPAEFEPVRRETKDCFYRRFRAAWEAVDLDGADETIEIRLDAGVRARASHDDVPPRQAVDALRSALRPLRRWIVPLARRLFPEIGRLAQHGGWRKR